MLVPELTDTLTAEPMQATSPEEGTAFVDQSEAVVHDPPEAGPTHESVQLGLAPTDPPGHTATAATATRSARAGPNFPRKGDLLSTDTRLSSSQAMRTLPEPLVGRHSAPFFKRVFGGKHSRANLRQAMNT